MKITVNFISGDKQSFIVPRDILATEFKALAEKIGGRIGSIEFPRNTQHTHHALYHQQETPLI